MFLLSANPAGAGARGDIWQEDIYRHISTRELHMHYKWLNLMTYATLPGCHRRTQNPVPIQKDFVQWNPETWGAQQPQHFSCTKSNCSTVQMLQAFRSVKVWVLTLHDATFSWQINNFCLWKVNYGMNSRRSLPWHCPPWPRTAYVHVDASSSLRQLRHQRKQKAKKHGQHQLWFHKQELTSNLCSTNLHCSVQSNFSLERVRPQPFLVYMHGALCHKFMKHPKKGNLLPIWFHIAICQLRKPLKKRVRSKWLNQSQNQYHQLWKVGKFGTWNALFTFSRERCRQIDTRIVDWFFSCKRVCPAKSKEFFILLRGTFFIFPLFRRFFKKEAEDLECTFNANK